MYANNAYSQYKTNSVNFASKEQLLLMLLDGSVKFSKIARKAIMDKNIIVANENIKKTQNIFYELIASLDLNTAGDWGKNMVSVYKFIIGRLVQANMKKDVAIMDEVIPLIEDVKNLWNETYSASIKLR
ncbi:flagellar protein FliS [Clostridium acidisoli DSM 12555]|jgi:flagellar protein FliS|uniref:Flagellar secretion chaperone FliS n=1 Tax=Clostridium acidisoli DSM 12555 TaxID=1121291 RepID=A0A1W1X2D3_9CLOT|nr:flagellar export chaperone FliS [Clostridium acidisoli]SMC17920.1 flagellar protein FliS [Clostridium acidisoli DSM 12555]